MRTSDASGELKALRLAVAMYAVVVVLKFVAYFLTGLLALLAEAFHTLADLVVSAFLLFAASWSRREADADHMFGHGRAQNVAGLVAAVLFISFTSLRLFEEAIPALFKPHLESHANFPFAIAVIVVSMLLAAVPLVKLARSRDRGAAAKAQLIELRNDQLGLLAALVGTLFVMHGEPRADPIAAIIVAVVIAANAVGLFRENLALLLGTSPGATTLARIEGAAREVPGVLGVHQVRAEHVGLGLVHADLHIDVDAALSVVDGHRIAKQVRDKVLDVTGCSFCNVHADPITASR